MKKTMRVLVTAGPTREFIDPVRYITNLSTGQMGYSIAEEARKRKHKVVLISGPTNKSALPGVRHINVITAKQMFKAVKSAFKRADCLIMAAAVCDFRPANTEKHKIKKVNAAFARKLCLEQNPDILSWAGENKGNRILVGFCMESRNLARSAQLKLRSKNLDIIAANKIDKQNTAFGCNKTNMLILQRGKQIQKLNKVTKSKAAQILLDKTEGLWYK